MTEKKKSSNLQLETRILKGVLAVSAGIPGIFLFLLVSNLKCKDLMSWYAIQSVFVAYVLFAYPQSIVEKKMSHLSHQGRILYKKDFVEIN